MPFATKEKEKAFRKEYRNRPEVKVRTKERKAAYEAANPGLHKSYAKKFRETNRERVNAQALDYYHRNREAIKKKLRERYKTDPQFFLAKRLRGRIRVAVRRTTSGKKAKGSIELLGISIEAFKRYLESKFLPGMTFENASLWHIDHIKPCADFDLTDSVQQAACFHYTNLQPLWATDNLKKNKY